MPRAGRSLACTEGELKVHRGRYAAGPGFAAIARRIRHEVLALTAGKAIVVDYPLRKLAS